MAKRRAIKPHERGVEVHETAAGKRPRSPLDLAAPVTSVVNLETILVEECSAKRAVEVYDATQHNTVITLEKAEIGRPKGSDRLSVSLRFTLNVYPKGAADREEDEASNPLVSMMCKFVIIYRVSSFDNIEDENLIAFGKTSGVFSVWPYWREYVHSTAFRLSVPPIVLPTYRVKPL